MTVSIAAMREMMRTKEAFAAVRKLAPSARTITVTPSVGEYEVIVTLEYALPGHVEAVQEYLDLYEPGMYVVKSTGPNA